MYISRLDIFGFKSFAKKTDLQFGPGITGIVGPNGCGKTNVVDAIRWVLGEQKTSVLRSDSMQEVIFNGSHSMKPLGMCEVSLTIHNNRDVLPVEYNDVVVTRRLYRDGQSEYLLNKKPCRLKDIQNLFVDTGMGADAYSVIELKMVENILSDTKDERSRMFEEAAGINKYKQERRAAYRKLDATKEDLLRINQHYLTNGFSTGPVSDREPGKDTQIVPPVYYERNVHIGEHCQLGPNVYIEHSSTIGDHVTLRNAVVLRERQVFSGAEISGQVIF